MADDRAEHWGPIALLCAVAVARFAIVGRWELLADEAWYRAWSDQLALGYYDQPPAIAWAIAASRAVLGDSVLAIRALPALCGLTIGLALLGASGDRWTWAGWCALVPFVAWLPSFATPDALLLGCWALALAGACRGGWGWVVAGAAAGLAFEAKHTAAVLLPLLFAAAPSDLRARWPWIGMAIAALLAAPNLVWNASHGWVTVRFQASEGLWHAEPPGIGGAITQVIDQLGVATPVVGLVAVVWCVARAPGLAAARREVRLAWWTSAPLLAGFALAGALAPADAHWTAPAWIGVGLGVSYESGRWSRATWSGLGIALAATVAALVHTIRPVFPLDPDPVTRLTEGPVFARVVQRLAAPAPGLDPPVVVTERYQEAAFIQYYAGLDARVAPGCGRPGQQDLWPAHPVHGRALFVRPATGGPPDCVLDEWRIVSGPLAIEAADAAGRRLGPWQAFELEAR